MAETTNPTPTTALKETWGSSRYRMENKVELAGAPDIHAKGQAYSPYTITFDFRRADGSPWQAAYITIYATKRYPGGGTALIGTCLSPHRLDEVPGWLDDIIDRATPQGG